MCIAIGWEILCSSQDGAVIIVQRIRGENVWPLHSINKSPAYKMYILLSLGGASAASGDQAAVSWWDSQTLLVRNPIPHTPASAESGTEYFWESVSLQYRAPGTININICCVVCFALSSVCHFYIFLLFQF